MKKKCKHCKKEVSTSYHTCPVTYQTYDSGNDMSWFLLMTMMDSSPSHESHSHGGLPAEYDSGNNHSYDSGSSHDSGSSYGGDSSSSSDCGGGCDGGCGGGD